jgi:hypothetical protein
MSEQNQGMCLSKYMKNCEKNILKNIIDILFVSNPWWFLARLIPSSGCSA